MSYNTYGNTPSYGAPATTSYTPAAGYGAPATNYGGSSYNPVTSGSGYSGAGYQSTTISHDSPSRNRGVYDAFNSLRTDQVVEVNVKNELTNTIRQLIGMNEEVSSRLYRAEQRANAIEGEINRMAASMGASVQVQQPQQRNVVNTVTAIDPNHWNRVKSELEQIVSTSAQSRPVREQVVVPNSNTGAELDAFLALFNMSRDDIRHHANGSVRSKLEYIYDLPAWSGLIQWAHQPTVDGHYEMVDQIVEVPIRIPVKTVEKVIERPTPVVVEKVVEKPAQVVMMERVVEKPVVTERIVEQPSVRMQPTVERVPQVVMTERIVERPVQVMEQVVEKVAGHHLAPVAGPYVQTQSFVQHQGYAQHHGYGHEQVMGGSIVTDGSYRLSPNRSARNIQ